MKIRIGPFDFDIVEVDGLLDKDRTDKLNGHIIFDDGVIKIESRLCAQEKRHTLWHEIVHAIARTWGVELNEHDTDLVAIGVEQVLRDNPWLVK